MKGRKALVRLLHVCPTVSPNIVASDWVHGQIYLRWYFGIGDYIIIDSSEDFRELDLPVLKDTFYHTIRGDGERILIEFKH